MNFPFPMLAALTSVGAYTFMQLVFKRATGAHPLALTALLSILLPFWLGLLLLGLDNHLLVFKFSWAYAGWTALWAGLGVTSMGLLFWLIQRLALTELAAYRKLFSLVLALLLDALLLGVLFPPIKLVLMGLILAGSVALTQGRQGKGPFPWRDIAAVMTVCLLMVLQLWAYKRALALQPDVISHIFAAKAVFAVVSMGWFVLPSVRAGAGSMHWGLVTAVAILFFIGSLAEGFALQNLPMSLVIVAGLAMSGLFALHDLWHGDLPRKPGVILAIIVVLGGFVALVKLG